jgi:hypothetical protein
MVGSAKRMNPELKPLADLIESLTGDVHGLSREMRDGFQRIESQLDAIRALLDRQERDAKRWDRGSNGA